MKLAISTDTTVITCGQMFIMLLWADKLKVGRVVQSGAEWRIGSPFRPRSGRRGLKRRGDGKREGGSVGLGFHYFFLNRTDLHNLTLLIVDECNHLVKLVHCGLDVVIISKFNRRSQIV